MDRLTPPPKVTQEQLKQAIDHFAKQGWKLARIQSPPDAKLISYDLDVAAKRPEEMLVQLRSVAVPTLYLPHIARLIEKTRSPVIREAALDAVARSRSEAAGKLMIDLYRKQPALRNAIIWRLYPKRVDDSIATFISALLNDRTLSARQRGLLINRVAAIAAGTPRDQRKQWVRSIMNKLSRDEGRQFAQQLRRVQSGGIIGEHKHKTDPRAIRDITRAQFQWAQKRMDETLRKAWERNRARREKRYHIAVKVGADGTLVPATDAELRVPGRFGQVVIMPTGYTKDDHDSFMNAARHMVLTMGNLPREVFTRKHRDRIIYLIHWIPGGAMDDRPNFNAAIYDHPMRADKGLTTSKKQVTDALGILNESVNKLQPVAVMVVFNHRQANTTANAVMPMLHNGKYGIVRITHADIYSESGFEDKTWADYVAMHELAHGALNWADEYVDATMEGQSVDDLDFLVPLMRPDGTWQGLGDAWEDLVGNYDMRLGEIIAENGWDNVADVRHPSRVSTENYTPNPYEVAGGMFFSFGTWHDRGNNVMDDHQRNLYGWGHSPGQQRLLNFVFTGTGRPPRPNDRLRCAGPINQWLPQWGEETRLMIFDGDKNHRWHPTLLYEVEIGFDVTNWRGETQFVGFRQIISPRERNFDLSKSLAIGPLGLFRDLLVGAGMNTLEMPGADRPIDLGAMTVNELLDSSLPAVIWPLPYQDITVTTFRSFTTYKWRVRAHNGQWSGWTGWSTFYRAF